MQLLFLKTRRVEFLKLFQMNVYGTRVKNFVANTFRSIVFISIFNPENANNGIYELV